MAVGDRIKRVRNIRGMTQKELGLAVGFDDNSADVRIAQYESGTRTPKEDMLKKIAEILDVNFRSLYEATLYAAEDIMFSLFELDEHYKIGLSESDDKKIGVVFDSVVLNGFMREWLLRKQELAENKITKQEYMEWKLNFPQTADDCGKFTPSKQWRIDNSDNDEN
jgi:transcriptional regulator with XRE-family HTH domain